MILADAGFLYALLDKDDAWHVQAKEVSRDIKEKWITTWPVLTEAAHLITRWLGAEPAIALMQDVAVGDIAVWNIAPETCLKVPVLMKRYADLPMDLADASLVLLAESLGHGRILTTDERDFRTYRWKSRRPFQNLLMSDDD
jgi:predicted nucleic acid-binding protein